MDVLTTINGFYPSLTKAEKKIAQYVLVNSEEIEILSIGELASKVEVAETTVIRFCRKLKFKGYQDFKLHLARDLAANQVRQQTESETEYPIVNEYIDYLKRFSKSINTLDLEQIAQMVDKAHSVCVFGAGVSAIVGSYLKTRLTRMGIAVIFDPDIHLQAIDIAVLKKNDLVIAISASGNTRDLLTNVKIAKHFGVKIIAVSNYLSSKLADISDIALVPPAGSGRDSSEFLPVMGQLAVIDMLCQKLQEINPERTKTLKERINETLINRIE
ncbi:MurR/RpiR family transcriptional regulator [Pediococcus siamensis]|uniref:MurR/RpiR family transcriptional regulator n=1 Tax=Pediococcus siamensis TaxID=381829 RepID=UPI0039A1BADC